LDGPAPVRNGNRRNLLTRAVAALDGEQVAIVQRSGLHPDQHLARSGLGDGPVDEPETFCSVRSLQFVALHGAPLSSVLSVGVALTLSRTASIAASKAAPPPRSPKAA